jgi:hypothetical protein
MFVDKCFLFAFNKRNSWKIISPTLYFLKLSKISKLSYGIINISATKIVNILLSVSLHPEK